jgi:adenylate cyclase
MGIEIERKFLLKNDSWKSLVTETHMIKQGYLQSGLDASQKSSVRIRISNKLANINVKSVDLNMVRQEFEYDIPLHDAEEMLATLCSGVIIEKIRYYVPIAHHLWEIDVFSGANAGLQVAEIELGSVGEAFEKPDWIGDEVSEDKRYYNIYLLKSPYSMWSV